MLVRSTTIVDNISASDVQIPGENKTYLGVTFQPNKKCGIHCWYPYVEGFSGEFVSNMLDEFGITSGLVFDPFGGCGTTALTASLIGIDSVITDVNPFMCFVAKAKTQRYQIASLRQVKAHFKRRILSYTTAQAPKDNLSPVFEDKNYFRTDAMHKIRFLKHLIGGTRNPVTCDFFSQASNEQRPKSMIATIPSNKMIHPSCRSNRN